MSCAQRVSGSGGPPFAGWGSGTELCVGGGVGSGYFDGLHRTIRRHDETGNGQRASYNAHHSMSGSIVWRLSCQWQQVPRKTVKLAMAQGPVEMLKRREILCGNCKDQHSCETNPWNLRPLLPSCTLCRN